MEVRMMKTFLVIILCISSFVLIGSILLSPAETAGLGAIDGGADSLFGKKKARGIYATLEKLTIGSSVIFMLSALFYAVLV